MSNRDSWRSFGYYEWHKGFYNDDSFKESLFSIQYEDFFKLPDDDEFPYGSAYILLCGSCHIFAAFLKKILGYTSKQRILKTDDISFEKRAFESVVKK